MGVIAEQTSLKKLNKEKRYKQQVQDAAAIAFVTMAENGQIDDVTASEQMEVFAEWAPGVNYAVGQMRKYHEKLYRCVQAHTSQPDWTPDAAASLWVVTSDPADEWPEWSQPVGAHDAYAAGAKVTHNKKHYVSAVDGNVWEPGAAGSNLWEEAP